MSQFARIVLALIFATSASLSISADAKSASTSPLILNEFSPPVNLAEMRATRALIRKFQVCLRWLGEKDGEKRLFAATARGNWPLYLKENDLGRKTLKGALEFMLSQLEGIESRLTDIERGISQETLGMRTPEVYRFLQVHHSLLLNFRDPVKRDISVGYGAYRYIKAHVDYPIARGDAESQDGATADTDPIDGTFWMRPRSIARKDLATGYDRAETLPQMLAKLEKPCVYHEPKTSNGTTAGATLKCGKSQIKIKFRETKSEAFASRIFWAMGYNVEPVDYMNSISFEYDRKFFKEINSRRNIGFKITMFGLPVSEFTITQIVDPFEQLQGAILKSGRRVDAANLKKMIIRSPNPDFTRLRDEDFNADAESQVALVLTKEVQVQEKQEKSDDFVKVGPWDWSDLDYVWRRDMRGAVAPAVWLGWFDCRFDNNRLVLERDPKTGKMRLKHYLSDLGGTLGDARDFMSTMAQDLNHFPNQVTTRGLLGMHVVNLSLLDRNRTFEAATEKDMQWGLRYLNQITTQQLRDAARAAGFTQAESRVLIQKLESRRANMNRSAGF